ncbi:MAG: hypothetical protein ROO70_02625 [Labrenzia sp.]
MAVQPTLPVNRWSNGWKRVIRLQKIMEKSALCHLPVWNAEKNQFEMIGVSFAQGLCSSLQITRRVEQILPTLKSMMLPRRPGVTPECPILKTYDLKGTYHV